MELSKDFVERLSQIFFNEEKDENQNEASLSKIFFNKEMIDNIPRNKRID